MLHSVAATTRSGARKTRPSHLVAAVAGAALALAVSTGVTHLHGTPPRQSAHTLNTRPESSAAAVAPRGGAAEAIPDPHSSVAPARGGLAESLDAVQPAFTLHTVDLTPALPGHGGLAEALAEARSPGVTTTVDTGAVVPARGGLAESIADGAGVAGVRSAAQSAPALQPRGGMAEAIADRLAAAPAAQ